MRVLTVSNEALVGTYSGALWAMSVVKRPREAPTTSVRRFMARSMPKLTQSVKHCRLWITPRNSRFIQKKTAQVNGFHRGRRHFYRTRQRRALTLPDARGASF